MGKDPAFLFYPADWIGGTMGMTFEEKGAYLELLILQFNRGHMKEHMITHMVGDMWEAIKDKFQQDEGKLWYNVRLDEEKYRRKAYTDSRKSNLQGKTKKNSASHMAPHMVNVNVNVDVDKTKDSPNSEKEESPLIELLNWCYSIWPNEKKTEPMYLLKAMDEKTIKSITENVVRIRRNLAVAIENDEITSRRELKWYLMDGNWQHDKKPKKWHEVTHRPNR